MNYNAAFNEPRKKVQIVTCKRCHALVEIDKASRVEYRGRYHIICHECQAEMEKNKLTI